MKTQFAKNYQNKKSVLFLIIFRATVKSLMVFLYNLLAICYSLIEKFDFLKVIKDHRLHHSNPLMIILRLICDIAFCNNSEEIFILLIVNHSSEMYIS